MRKPTDPSCLHHKHTHLNPYPTREHTHSPLHDTNTTHTHQTQSSVVRHPLNGKGGGAGGGRRGPSQVRRTTIIPTFLGVYSFLRVEGGGGFLNTDDILTLDTTFNFETPGHHNTHRPPTDHPQINYGRLYISASVLTPMFFKS